MAAKRQERKQQEVEIIVVSEPLASEVKGALAVGMEGMSTQQKLNFLYQLASLAITECKSDAERASVIRQIRADVLSGNEAA